MDADEIKEIVNLDAGIDENADRLMMAYHPPEYPRDLGPDNPLFKLHDTPLNDVVAAAENEYYDRMAREVETKRDDTREQMDSDAHVEIADYFIGHVMEDVEEARSRLDEDEPLLHRMLFSIELELHSRIEDTSNR